MCSAISRVTTENKRRKQTIRIKSEARYKSKYFDTTTLVNTLLISIRLKAK